MGGWRRIRHRTGGRLWHARRQRRPRLADPELVDECSPYGVVLVVAGAAGDEVGLVGGDGGQPDREVGELLVQPGPEGGGGGGVGGLQLRGAGDLPVQRGAAEFARVGGGLSVAGDEVAAGELAD